MPNERTTEQVAQGIRRRVFEHSIRNNGGHLSQACSAAEQLAFLYNEALNLGPSTMPLIPPPFAGVPSKDNPAYVTGAGYNGAPAPERLFIAPPTAPSWPIPASSRWAAWRPRGSTSSTATAAASR